MAKQRGIELTREVIYAAGWDAGYRSMSAAGRAKWNKNDFAEAARVSNRLAYQLASPAIQAAMLRDGLV